MITAQTIRDKYLCSVLINYDWTASAHNAEISLSGTDDKHQTYIISGLSDYNISEDFGAMYIERCTLIIEPGRVYLSLDPYTEGKESTQDNYTFTGKEISACR